MCQSQRLRQPQKPHQRKPLPSHVQNGLQINGRMAGKTYLGGKTTKIVIHLGEATNAEGLMAEEVRAVERSEFAAVLVAGFRGYPSLMTFETTRQVGSKWFDGCD